MKLKTAITVMAAAGSLWGMKASAQFSYNPGDLFAAFRSTTSANDLVVDIGSASLYQNATGQFGISGVDAATLDSVFGSLNGIYWSVFGYASGNTLFTTSARSDVNTQSDAPPSAGNSGQNIVISYMHGVLNGATSGSATVLSGTDVEIPSGLNQSGNLSYSQGVIDPGLGSSGLGDWHTEWNTVENIANGIPTVSDLYQNNPGNPATTFGTYLGNFAFGSGGDLTFSPGISPAPEPATWGMFGAGIFALAAMRRIGHKK